MQKAATTFAFVTLELYPTTVGGTGILLHHTITALLTAGLNVVLYLDMAPDEITKFDQTDRHAYPNPDLLSYHDVGAMREALRFCEQLYDDKEQWRSVSFAHAILKTQDQHTIDLIEFYDYCGPAFHYLSVGASSRRPVAVRLHNTTEIIERGTRAPFQKARVLTFAMERAQLTLADLVLSPGENYYKEEILRLYAPELRRQLVATAPPIHAAIGQVAYSPQSRRILFYGRLSTFKGLDTFINGAVLALRNPDFSAWVETFVIAGPEETVASALTLDEMKSIIPDDLAPKFLFVGRLDHAQLLLLLEDVSFACFANRMESFCYAAHELNTAGIPLILSDRPAFKDHFSANDVIFFDGSASGLATAMIELAADPERRVRLSESGLLQHDHDGVALYQQFAQLAGERLADAASKAAAAEGQCTLTVFILSNGDRDAEQATLGSLTEAIASIYLLRADDKGPIVFAGSCWSMSDDQDLLGLVQQAYVFLRAGDVCHAEILLQAGRDVATDDRLGAIAPWNEVDGWVRSSPQAFVAEYAAFMGPGIRTIIRSEGSLTVLELLRSGSSLDETSLLLAQRALGRAIVECPRVCVSIGAAVALPPPRTDVATDYDRMSPTYLALSRGLVLPATVGARRRQQPTPIPTQDYELLSIRATAVFGAGELWVLRVFRQRGAMHEPWSIAQQTGDWKLVQEAHSPAGGALKTDNGELSFWGDNDFGIELLWGPFCGGAEIRFRDCLYEVKLTSLHIASSVIWLNDLIRGVAQGPQRDGNAVIVVGRSYLSQTTSAWIQANIRADTQHLVMKGALSRPEMLTGSVAIDLVSLLGPGQWTAADIAFALLAAIITMDRCTIHVPFWYARGPEIADLVLQSGRAQFVVDVDEYTAPLRARGLYRSLAQWSGMLSKHAGLLTVSGSNDDLIFPLAQAGATVVRSRHQLPRCTIGEFRSCDEVDVVILRGEGLIDNVAHMVAGVAFLTMSGTKVATLYLEDSQWHAALVSETLSAARACASYKSLEHVIALRRDRPLIACAVFPDPFIPSQALTALSLGTLALVGPVGLSPRFQKSFKDLTVAYWEDSRDIGDALIKIARGYATIAAGYNETIAAAVEDQPAVEGASSGVGTTSPQPRHEPRAAPANSGLVGDIGGNKTGRRARKAATKPAAKTVAQRLKRYVSKKWDGEK